MKLRVLTYIIFLLFINMFFYTPAHSEQTDSIINQALKDNANRREEERVPPVLEIKPLDSRGSLYSIELRAVELDDLFRVIAHDYKLNILVDKDISGKITASFNSITLEEALEGIAELSNLNIEKNKNIIKISPNLITRVLILKHIEAKRILQSNGQIDAGGFEKKEKSKQDTTGVNLDKDKPGQEKENSNQGIGQREPQGFRQTSTIYDLLSDKGKVLFGMQPNSIMVIDYPPNIKKVEDYLAVVDQKMTSRVFKLKYLKATDIAGELINNGPGIGAASLNKAAANKKSQARN